MGRRRGHPDRDRTTSSAASPTTTSWARPTTRPASARRSWSSSRTTRSSERLDPWRPARPPAATSRSRSSPARASARASLGLVDAGDPEVDDRADAQELLAAGVAEVLARPRAGMTRSIRLRPRSRRPGAPFEPREPSLELGDAVVLGEAAAARAGGRRVVGLRLVVVRSSSSSSLAGLGRGLELDPQGRAVHLRPLRRRVHRARGSRSVRRQPPTCRTSSSRATRQRSSPLCVNGSSTWST